MSRKKFVAGMYILTLLLVAADRFIKAAVAANMQEGQRIPEEGGFFSLYFIRNEGAAFSMFKGMDILLITVPALFIAAALVFMMVKSSRITNLSGTAAALICAGGIGNIIDRIVDGSVIDYISVGSFPVFNFADICVCTGCGLLILYIILNREKTSE